MEILMLNYNITLQFDFGFQTCGKRVVAILCALPLSHKEQRTVGSITQIDSSGLNRCALLLCVPGCDFKRFKRGL